MDGFGTESEVSLSRPSLGRCARAQAWALFKGKFREGIDKPDPPTWKTRLRCALNKSNDFEELVERSQLDISDPYKVYRIVPEGAKKSQCSRLARALPLYPSYSLSLSPSTLTCC